MICSVPHLWWWYCKRLVLCCAHHCKMQDAKFLCPETEWSQLHAHSLSVCVGFLHQTHPHVYQLRVPDLRRCHWVLACLWKLGDFHPVAPQSRTAKQKRITGKHNLRLLNPRCSRQILQCYNTILQHILIYLIIDPNPKKCEISQS